MNCPFLVIAGLSVFILACNEKNPVPADSNPAAAAKDSIKAPQQFFPVASFLKGEIDYVDSLPVGIMKFRTTDSKTDSGYIKLPEFHKLAGEFLEPELTDPAFSKEFKETSFLDRATNGATFLYSTNDTTNHIKRVDVVTTKGDVYDEVKSIYIEKNRTTGDSLIVKKMFWKPKHNFQIITLISVKDQKPKNELVKVVWDNGE